MHHEKVVVVHHFATTYLCYRAVRRTLALQDSQPGDIRMAAVEKTDDLAAFVEKTAEQAAQSLSKARNAIGSVIFGQERVIEQVLVTILSGGHGLLVGLPGLAKTKLVDTLAPCSA